jgi:hypothetical protein
MAETLVVASVRDLTRTLLECSVTRWFVDVSFLYRDIRLVHKEETLSTQDTVVA